MVTKGIIFLDVLGLFCKAVLCTENFISVKISSTIPQITPFWFCLFVFFLAKEVEL